MRRDELRLLCKGTIVFRASKPKDELIISDTAAEVFLLDVVDHKRFPNARSHWWTEEQMLQLTIKEKMIIPLK